MLTQPSHQHAAPHAPGAAPLSPRRVVTSHTSNLAAIHLPDVNLVVWRRHLVPALASAVAHALAHGLDPLDVQLDAHQPLPAGIPAALSEDVTALTQTYLALTGVRRVRVRLSRVASNECRSFHTDNLHFRLLCTYAGPGTQYLLEPDLCREMLGPASAHLPGDQNRYIVRDFRRVHRAAPGHVLLMKGALAAPDAALVHRSPPIEAQRQARIRLTVDEGFRQRRKPQNRC